MGQIKPYVSQMQSVGPVDTPKATAESFGAGLGRGIEQAGNAIMQTADLVQKRNEQDEISRLSAETAKAQAELTNEYQDQLRKGTLKADEFNAKVKERMDGMMEGVSTRAGQLHLQQSGARLGSHFQEASAAGQAQLAGVRAVENKKTAYKERSSTLLKDPSSFNATLELHRADFNASVQSGEMDFATATKMSAEIEGNYAKNAIRGWLKLSPDDAKAQLDSGKWDQFIDGDAKHQMYGEVDQEVRARKTEKTYLEAQELKVKEAKAEKYKTEAFDRIQAGTFNAKELADNDFLSLSEKTTIFNLANTNATRDIKTDTGTYLNLLDRISAPDGDPRKIIDDKELIPYAVQGKLTLTDLNGLRSEVSGRKTEAGQQEATAKDLFYKEIRGRLSKSNDLMGIVDPEGDANFRHTRFEMEDAFAAGRKAGKSVRQLLDRESPDYIGKGISGRRSTDIIKSQAAKTRAMTPTVTPTPRPTPKPRKDGESTADYLKRMKADE